LVAALGLSLATNISYAVALKGTVARPIPLWPATEVQLAMCFSNVIIPVVGGFGLQVRFLQEEGADLPTAVAAGGLLSSVATVLTQLPMFLLGLWLSPRAVTIGGISTERLLGMAGLALVGAAVVAALLALVPRLRSLAHTFVRGATDTFLTALRSPRQLALLVGGNAATGLLYALSLWMCLYAFGVHPPFLTVMAINMGVSFAGALIPLPGGGSSTRAVGLTALIAGLGVHAQVAVAATLAYQLVGTYVPAALGWPATRDLLTNRWAATNHSDVT
jgi:uncharacterized membrane protein YbhN (UPF0104 family)